MEVILDLKECDPSTFNRQSLRRYFKVLCEKIDMQRDKLVFWDDIGVPEEYQQDRPHTKGTSAVQFILTSSIVIHTLDMTGEIYINIFSCKGFNADIATEYTLDYFKGKIRKQHVIDRGVYST